MLCFIFQIQDQECSLAPSNQLLISLSSKVNSIHEYVSMYNLACSCYITDTYDYVLVVCQPQALDSLNIHQPVSHPSAVQCPSGSHDSHEAIILNFCPFLGSDTSMWKIGNKVKSIIVLLIDLLAQSHTCLLV